MRAMKGLSVEELAGACKNVITDSHVVADHIFRSVLEDWEPAAQTSSYQKKGEVATTEILSQGDTSQMRLPSWTGISAGVTRLSGLLYLLRQYVAESTASTVKFPVGAIVDLLTRIFTLTVPLSRENQGGQSGVRLNTEIGREERDGLWIGLPQIHVAAMSVLVTMIDRLGCGFLPMAQEFLDLVLWVFNAENTHG